MDHGGCILLEFEGDFASHCIPGKWSAPPPPPQLEKPKLIPVPERPKVPPPAAERPAAAVAPEIPQSTVVPGKEQVAARQSRRVGHSCVAGAVSVFSF